MSTGTWQPATAAVPTLSADEIAFIASNADDAGSIIKTAPYDAKASIMKQPLSYWEPLIADCSDEQLWQLIRFFTLAEEADSSWFAGEESPAIHCNSVLKKRGTRLTKEQLQWIRANSSNRFIPNGPLKL